MSYRNPPIIVDRSTDVWGKAIAGFGQQIAKGILTANEARRKAEQAQAAQARKEAQAQQKLTTATRASYMDEARDKYIQIKKNGGISLAQQFMKQVEIDLNGGDGKIGAIDASVQLALNNNLSKDQRAAYNDEVDKAKMYQAEAVSGFGNLVSGLDYAKEKKENMQTKPGGWTYKGANDFERLQSQLAHYALDTDTMINADVIEDRKTYKGDQGEIFVEATTLVPMEQFNEGGTFSDIVSKDKQKELEKVTKNGKDYYKFSYKRDVREWDGELVTDIPALPDYSKVYQEVNIEDDKGSIATNLISEIQKTEDGYNVEEQILDIGTIRKNLETVMSGQASRIMAGSDQELQAFLNFGIEKGGMTIKEFNKTYPNRDDRLNYIQNSLIDDSINKKFSIEFGSDRKATPDDVKRIKAYNPSSTVKVGDDIRFKRIKQDIIEPDKGDKPTEGTIKRKIAKETAETVLNDMLESPKSYFKDRRINGKKVSDVRIVPSTVGEGGEKEGRTLEIGYESGTSTTGGERTIFTDEMTFDLDDPVRVRTLIDMLPEGDALKTALKKLTGKKNPLLNLNN